MADYFLQGFGSVLPDEHPARADLMQAPRLGKEQHTGLVAYELTDLALDWLQELVGQEGGETKLLDNLPAPNVDLEGRRRRILQVRASGPRSREAADHALKVQELFSEGRLFPRPNARARASMPCSSAEGRSTTHSPPKQPVKPWSSTSSATGMTPKTRPSRLGGRRTYPRTPPNVATEMYCS